MCKRAEDFLFPPTGAIGQYRKGYENGYERGKAELAEVLDKISAEIEERIAVYDNWQTQRECTATEANTMREALAIVKKYMAESEG